MRQITRRQANNSIFAFAISILFSRPVMAVTQEDMDQIPAALEKVSADEWIGSWKAEAKLKKDLQGPLDLRRFLDPTYVLLNNISWKQKRNCCIAPVVVPEGFVTDFASVPRVFWSLFRPDGNYAYAAVVHDFLYWEQSRPKAEADLIFRLVMDELDISDFQAAILFKAVDLFGRSAWNQNAELKKHGERRVLRVKPSSSDVLWSDWKSRPGVF